MRTLVLTTQGPTETETGDSSQVSQTGSPAGYPVRVVGTSAPRTVTGGTPESRLPGN